MSNTGLATWTERRPPPPQRITRRLNVGCGEFYQPGWVNVDLAADASRRIDVAATATALPFAPGSLQAAYCGHVLEHLPLDLVTTVLSGLRATLASGAKLMVVGPDVDRADAMFLRGEIGAGDLNDIRYGGNRWPGDQHLWPSRERTLVECMEAAGFIQVAAVPIAAVGHEWPVVSRIGWQCAVRGERPDNGG